MMVQVRIGGQKVDYEEVNTLPLSFSKGTDDIEAIVGTLGTTVDNEAGRLFLPATNANNNSLDQACIPSSDTSNIQQDLDAEIKVQGEISFSGKAVLSDIVYQNGRASGYGLKLFGDADEFFGLIGDLRLNELELGQILYQTSNIVSSWTQSYDTGYGAVFAPVIYKKSSGSSTQYEFAYTDFRPHVYFRTILDGILSSIGYTFDSVLFDLEIFKRHVYLFGVGDAWRKSQLSQTDFTAIETQAINPTTVNFLGIPTLRYTASATDTYEISLEGPGMTSAEVRVRNLTQAIDYAESATLPHVVQEPLNAGDVIEVQARQTASGAVINSPLVFKVTSSTAPTLGSQVSLASCLPNDRVTDFLAGISHMFNLAWRVNTRTRTVRVDPRFDFSIDSTTYPGFYRHGLGQVATDSSTHPQDIDGIVDFFEVDAEFVSPFGDGLILKNQEDGSDLGTRARQTDNQAVDYGGAQMDMVSRGLEPVTVENPYFQDLHTCGFTQGGCFGIPWVGENFDLSQGYGDGDDDNAFVIDPKYGVYYGYERLGGGWWIQGESASRSLRPVLFQQPPFFIPSNLSLGFVGSYNDHTQALPGGGTETIPGYVSIFYPHYHAVMKKGFKVAPKANVSGPLFYNEGFDRLKVFTLEGSKDLYILQNIEGYRPLSQEKSTLTMYKYAPPTNGLEVNHNTQSPNIDISPLI